MGQMRVREARLCPALARCTTTPTTTPTTKPTTKPTITTSTASTIAEIAQKDPLLDIADERQSLRSNKNMNEVDSGLVNTCTWTLAAAYISVTILISQENII